MINLTTIGWALFALAATAVLFLTADNQGLRFEIRQKTVARDDRGRFRAKHDHAARWRGV